MCANMVSRDKRRPVDDERESSEELDQDTDAAGEVIKHTDRVGQEQDTDDREVGETVNQNHHVNKLLTLQIEDIIKL